MGLFFHMNKLTIITIAIGIVFSVIFLEAFDYNDNLERFDLHKRTKASDKSSLDLWKMGVITKEKDLRSRTSRIVSISSERYELFAKDGVFLRFDTLVGDLYILDKQKQAWVKIRLESIEPTNAGENSRNLRKLKSFNRINLMSD